MTDDPRALDYALGALSADERAELSRARLHDAALDRSIDTLELSLAALAPAGTIALDATLWDRIATALDLERREFAEVELHCFADGDWEPMAPAIEAKQLWSARTHLLRCQPGASDGEHIQEEDEHIVLIAGDVVIGGRALSTGDHLVFAAGTRHPAMRTMSGCILLVHYC